MLIRPQIGILGVALLFGACAVRASRAQEQGAQPSPSESESAKRESSSLADATPGIDEVTKTSEGTRMGLLGRFMDDQKGIWTSPAHLRSPDANWLVPLGGITAGLFVTDRDFSRHLSQSPTTISRYKTLSNAGAGALVGGAAGMWLLGRARHNEHWSETGFLAGEAALNSLVMVEGLKYSLRRERPYVDNANGSFFQHGGTSFPSEHAAAVWSVAGVIAHEYPGPLTKIMAYGLASVVDYSRIRGQQHFPSDVLVGTVIGNLIAQNIYSRHYNPDLGGGEWRTISQLFRGDGNTSPANQGSPYVPLDSWIYPALDRLIGMGMIDSGFAGMRPWTRRECARLLGEAAEKLSSAGEQSETVARLVEALEREFRPETESAGGAGNGTLRLESLYSRTEHISGVPLNDGYHFAQTQINDFGRPYGEGWNTVDGFSAYATWGRWVAYVRGEEQAAPATPALPLTARLAIQQMDSFPQAPPDSGHPSVNQFDVLDAYVGWMQSNWQVSFGRQSLSWGPGDGGSMMFSNNADPIEMFRINRTSPFQLPGFLGWLGEIRMEFFLGQKAGNEFVLSPLGFVGQFGQPLNPQPFLHGQKITFKPTANFEFSVSRTTTYGGPGYPFTWHTFLRTLFSTGNTAGGAPTKPGDRRAGFDLSYRLPGLRKWVSFYADGFSEDQFSPIAYADRSVWRAGLHFSRVPRIPRLDLRVEGVYSDNPLGGNVGPGYFYSNYTWRDGYTNNGNLIGSWIGRAGQGAQAWSNYWFGARNRLQFNFRHQKVSHDFSPGGGTLTDVGVRTDYWPRPSLGFTASVQYEKWLFPVIQPNASTNVTASVQIEFQPQKILRHGHFAEISAGTGDQP